ncbi:MAG TPA: glucose-1-phosphate cytidylyltransferase [Anaerolineales bacterium]|nr:glucose-1-phosphate cytidylyltransferase [Anaerolineales bacterium]HNF33558.1 glucose-1-phosphate cytidylyltransferase [Anaerolineales bacterium]
MKVAILAGGLGTRLSEETTVKPKPMVEVGGKPILWHIMNIYAAYGFKEFVVALGYKGEIIKDYFLNYHYRSRSITVQLKTGGVTAHNIEGEDWTVHLLDTGADTNTGGRVKRVAEFIGNETFMLTYGDGVGNIDINKLIKFHESHGKLVTMTAVRPVARFGQIVLQESQVTEFAEKPQTGEGWINGGFFVLQPEIIKYIDDEQAVWERKPMERLASDGQLMAYNHSEFWQCMDTLRDVQLLNNLWDGGNAPWKLW